MGTDVYLILLALQTPQTMPDLGQLTKDYGVVGVLIWLVIALSIVCAFLARALLASNTEWRKQLREDSAKQLEQAGLLPAAIREQTEAIRENTRAIEQDGIRQTRATDELRSEIRSYEARLSRIEALCARSGS